jgi:hypothetical protein
LLGQSAEAMLVNRAEKTSARSGIDLRSSAPGDQPVEEVAADVKRRRLDSDFLA